MSPKVLVTRDLRFISQTRIGTIYLTDNPKKAIYSAEPEIDKRGIEQLHKVDLYIVDESLIHNRDQLRQIIDVLSFEIDNEGVE